MEQPNTLIRNTWEKIGNDKDLSKGIVELHSNYVSTGGGIVWLKCIPSGTGINYVYIPRKDWNAVGDKINNFQLLSNGYNPNLHVLILLSIEGYCQLVRVNIDGDTNDDERTFEFQLS